VGRACRCSAKAGGAGARALRPGNEINVEQHRRQAELLRQAGNETLAKQHKLVALAIERRVAMSRPN
jgi:hypothetical protein